MFNKISDLSFGGIFALAAFALCLALYPVQAAAKNNKSDGWVSLPETERSSFAGIHGGTTPVSVMGSENEPAKEAVSGRTGQDFVQVLQGKDDSEATLTENAGAAGDAVALVPFGLGETKTADSGSSRLARLDPEKQRSKSHGAVRLKVDDLKVLNSEEAPVSPESLLQADELTRI